MLIISAAILSLAFIIVRCLLDPGVAREGWLLASLRSDSEAQSSNQSRWSFRRLKLYFSLPLLAPSIGGSVSPSQRPPHAQPQRKAGAEQEQEQLDEPCPREAARLAVGTVRVRVGRGKFAQAVHGIRMNLSSKILWCSCLIFTVSPSFDSIHRGIGQSIL